MLPHSVLRRIPFHTLLFASYSPIALLAVNLQEVEPAALARPLLACLALTAAALILARRLSGIDWARAGLVVTIAVLGFFSYGHVYNALKLVELLGEPIGRHRYLAPMFAALVVVLMWAVGRVRRPGEATLLLNLVAVALVAVPSATIGGTLLRSAAAAPAAPAAALHPPDGSPLPDVYLIVLDTYMRSDAMFEEFGYDNEPFQRRLEAMGFFVARCGRSNYEYTQASLAAVLNMDYLPGLYAILSERGLADRDAWYLIRHSVVRQSLEDLGYRTIAFDSGYDWSRIVDGDLYLTATRVSPLVGVITPFEALLLRSTAMSIWMDAARQASANRVDGVVYPFGRHIAQEEFILDQLPQVARLQGPKFVFAHLLMPHIPYVFAADGSIQQDPGFYAGPKAEPVNEAYRRSGYTGEVAYLNTRLLEFVEAALSAAEAPPVVILMGDHGLRGENRLQAFGAYLVPPSARPLLSERVTPVNVFRAVFSGHFGADLELLPDLSFSGAGTELAPETSTACTP